MTSSVRNSVVKSRTDSITVKELYDMLVTTSSLNPDPLYQRSSTIDCYQHPKNEGIIMSIFEGFGIDTLIFRDITSYAITDEIRKLYPGYKYLVIDAGHRCRAVKWFIQGKFYIVLNGEKKFYKDLTESERDAFLNTDVLVKYFTCSSEQARKLFLNINKMTKTNEIETIMADDINSVCRWIRERTWFYREYQNRNMIHPIFKVQTSDNTEYETAYWNKPNTGGSFFYHSFITLAKARGRGNVNAGQKVWEKLVADEVAINDKDEYIWTKFFDDLKKYQEIATHKDGINDEVFGFFSCVWFELLSKYGVDGFKIDMDVFAEELFRKRAELTGKTKKNRKSKYDDETIENIDGKEEDLKSVIREYVKAFAYGKKMSFAGNFILSEMGEDPSYFGVTVMDIRKNPSKKDRELLLNEQGNRCFIDGKHLKLEDAHAAHIIPRSEGGSSEMSNFRMVRKIHNQKMGTMTVDEYLVAYKNRKKHAA